MSTQQDEFDKPEQLASNQYPVIPQSSYTNSPAHHGYSGHPPHQQGQAPMAAGNPQQPMGLSIPPNSGQLYTDPQVPPHMNGYEGVLSRWLPTLAFTLL